MLVDSVRIIEDTTGVRVEDRNTSRIKYRCSQVKTAETFCIVRDLPVLEMRVKL